MPKTTFTIPATVEEARQVIRYSPNRLCPCTWYDNKYHKCITEDIYFLDNSLFMSACEPSSQEDNFALR